MEGRRHAEARLRSREEDLALARQRLASLEQGPAEKSLLEQWHRQERRYDCPSWAEHVPNFNVFERSDTARRVSTIVYCKFKQTSSREVNFVHTEELRDVFRPLSTFSKV